MLKIFIINLMEILYIYIIKKILFLFDPEKVHDSFIKFGRYIGEMQILRFFSVCYFVMMITT